MVVEVIYIVRHAFRMNFSVNHRTGVYLPGGAFPTGIPSDAVLTAHGPLLPLCANAPASYAAAVFEGEISEFYGRAWFKHPSPAPLSELAEYHFPGLLDSAYQPVMLPDVHGETIDMLHDRLACTLHQIIRQCDRDPTGPRAILLCSHAAAIIALGRVLTGDMPDDFATDDFQCYTAGLSTFKRRNIVDGMQVEDWDKNKPERIPQLEWKGGKGVMGGWDCLKNSDCSFLSRGEERGWRFHGDESFSPDPNGTNNAKDAETNEVKGSRL